MSAPLPPSYEDSTEKKPNSFHNPGYPTTEAPVGYGATPYPPAGPQPGYASAPYPPAPYPPGPGASNLGYNTAYSAYPNQNVGNTYNLGFENPKPANTHNFSPDVSDEEGFTTRNFSDKNVRRLFIQKVFSILTLQLLVTFGIVCLFTFCKPVNVFIQEHSWAYYIAYAFFLGLYITLVCCESVRRKYPQNIILLSIFTLAFSYMAGTIASFYSTNSVVICMGVTVVVCFAIILFSMQTKYDFTKCSGVLFVMSLVLFMFGIITAFTYSYNWYVHVVYGSLAALLFSLFLAFDVQLVMGGKKYELSPEDHILGAIQLYIDVVYIFLILLSLFGSRD